MRILLFGATGKVGTALLTHLDNAGHDVSAPNRVACNLIDPYDCIAFIDNEKPDIVINAAAYTNIERCESSPVTAYLLNAAAPAVMAVEAKRIGALFIHFSTDYVFDAGLSANNLREFDLTEARSVYGWTKLEGERAVRRFCPQQHLIFRLSTIYDNTATGPLEPISQAFNGRGIASDPIQVLSQYCCPTSATLVAEAVNHVVSDYAKCPSDEWQETAAGTYHLATSEPIWREAFIRWALDQTFVGHEDWRFTKYNPPNPRPIYTALSVTRFQETFEFDLPSWRTDLGRTIPGLVRPTTVRAS